MKVGIVVGNFNKKMTDIMLNKAKQTIKERNMILGDVIEVPGAFDMPLAIKKLLESNQNDAVVCIGVIKKGQTLHDEVIGFTVAKSMHELSIKYNKPVTNAIIGPGVTLEQAEDRLEEYAFRGVIACEELLKILN